MSGEVLLQSTSVDVTFSAYLASDHVTPATGKTIAITISKNKGAFGNPSGGATNATEISSGVYYVNLTTTDTGTLGPLVLRGAVATIDDVVVHYRVRLATNGDMTALPAVAAEAAGGLYTRGTGAGQIAQTSNGTADVRLADAVSHGGTLGSSTATLALSRVNVTSQTANTTAITVLGNGTGHGLSSTSGSGATGNGIVATSAATNGSGFALTGTGTGSGLLANTVTFSGAVALGSTLSIAGATTLAGLSTGALAATTITASGAVAFQSTFAVTTSTALGAVSGTTLTLSGAVAFQSTFAVTGATTLTGNVSLGDGLTIPAPSTLNRAGINITGNGTGAGIKIIGGSTGNGVRIDGGASGGDGLNVNGSAGGGSGAIFAGNAGGHGIGLLGDTAGFGSGLISSGYTGAWLQGSQGLHIQTNLTTETAVFIQGGGDTPTGIVVTGGVQVTGPTAGDALALIALGGSGGNGMSAAGDGAGLDITAIDNDLGEAVWDVAIAGHLAPGSTGAALNAAGAAGDPWITPLPGAYIAGQAGFIIGTNVDAPVSGVAASVWATTIATGVTAIQAMRGYIAALLGKSNGLPTAPKYRDVADTKNVIDATTDTDGNRSSVTLDLT